jgi:hypothetical protein
MKTEIQAQSRSSLGSITVYQRIAKGVKPGNVQLLRSTYKSTRGPDGALYRRTVNTPLLVVPAGTKVLSHKDSASLTAMGLSAEELEHVNLRLTELAERALPYVLAAKMTEAETHIKTASEIALDVPAARMPVVQLLKDILLVLDDSEVLRRSEAFVDGGGDSPQSCLLEALKMFNLACEKAQNAYRQLPKAEGMPEELILELQKTWFSSQDMLITFKGRPSFQRPGSWSKLRTQILSGKIYRKSDAAPKLRTKQQAL